MARKQNQQAETPIKPEQKDMRNADMVGLKTRKPKTIFHKILNEFGDSKRDLPGLENREDGECSDEDEDDIVMCKLSEDDRPCQVLGTISRTIPHHLHRFQRMQIKIYMLVQLGKGNMAEDFGQRD